MTGLTPSRWLLPASRLHGSLPVVALPVVALSRAPRRLAWTLKERQDAGRDAGRKGLGGERALRQVPAVGRAVPPCWPPSHYPRVA